CGGTTAHFAYTGGSCAPVTTGLTYIWSGMSFWKRSDSMKPLNARAPSGFLACASTHANSYCKKHVDVTTPTRGVSCCGLENTTLAGGLDAYETTIGRSPLPPPAVKSVS